MTEYSQVPDKREELLSTISELSDESRAKFILGHWDTLRESGARKVVKMIFESNVPKSLQTDHYFNAFVTKVKAAYTPWSLVKGYYRMCKMLLEVGQLKTTQLSEIIERIKNPFPLYERKYIEKRSSVINVIKRIIEGYITSSSNKNNVVAVVVYGSYSRNNFVWDSDLDIDLIYKKRKNSIPEARVEADLQKYIQEIRRLFVQKYEPDNQSIGTTIDIQKTSDYTMSEQSLQTFTEEIQQSTARNKHYIVISPYPDVKKKLSGLFVKKRKTGNGR